jgi:signal transduction histidine kinase
MAGLFNDLMTEILTNVSLTLAELSPYKSIRKKVQQVETLALNGKDIAGQLLTYSGRCECILLPTNLNDVVEDMKHLSWILQQGTKLKYELNDDIPMIEADGRKIRKVIVNLVTNATDALTDRQEGEGGEGVVRLTTGLARSTLDSAALGEMRMPTSMGKGDFVQLEVSDNGCGMDELTKEKMFDPFFTTKSGGRGLGLSEVQGIVSAHRGVIHVESEPGIGTTVRVTFPALA